VYILNQKYIAITSGKKIYRIWDKQKRRLCLRNEQL